MDDFYIDPKGLAAYYEIQWLDKLRLNGVTEQLESKSKHVPESFIESSHTQSVAQFVIEAIEAENIYPKSALEVGPALGRNSYELVTNIPTIRSVTVVEPSHRLLSNFKQIIIEGAKCQFPYIKSLKELGYFEFDASPIAKACNHVAFTLIEAPFEHGLVPKKFDLVICLNVLDQCESPKTIVEALMDATALNGMLILSCTYQWSKKHLKEESEAVDDINDYFGINWEKISEDEIEYKIRFNERYSLLFLSHVVAYKKVGK
ncbi:methyltransferase-like protein 9 [Photobacterium atrarenae]|uniref:Methyltransferase-like protein 9 n=1 Tax=Photobacterium atrarenae TaxID=865757 RepID=A0ABY5GBP0_9GAMM|nr:methyltransferase-like protein 9 [Photobacterium atrarenae]UTV26614.1 methyltransferase-like protein 9 [Photobacterium atrarenae]